MSNKGTNADIQATYGALVNRVMVAEEGLTVEGFIPFVNHILVEDLPPETKLGRIHLPENSAIHKAMGVVVKTNPLNNSGAALMQVGDCVLFFKDAGCTVEIAGKAYRILQYVEGSDSEILGHWPAKLFDKTKSG